MQARLPAEHLASQALRPCSSNSCKPWPACTRASGSGIPAMSQRWRSRQLTCSSRIFAWMLTAHSSPRTAPTCSSSTYARLAAEGLRRWSALSRAGELCSVMLQPCNATAAESELLVDSFNVQQRCWVPSLSISPSRCIGSGGSQSKRQRPVLPCWLLPCSCTCLVSASPFS